MEAALHCAGTNLQHIGYLPFRPVECARQDNDGTLFDRKSVESSRQARFDVGDGFPRGIVEPWQQPPLTAASPQLVNRPSAGDSIHPALSIAHLAHRPPLRIGTDHRLIDRLRRKLSIAEGRCEGAIDTTPRTTVEHLKVRAGAEPI